MSQQQQYLLEKLRTRLKRLEKEQLPAAEDLVDLSRQRLKDLRKDKSEDWRIQEAQIAVDINQNDLRELRKEIADIKRSLKK